MSRKKRVLRAGCITLLILAFIGYFAFSTFFFPPHGGRFKADVAGLIPRDVDVYLARADLKAAFSEFPRFAIADEVRENAAVQAFLDSPTWASLNEKNGIDATLADIEKELAALPLGLDILDVIGGEDVAVAGDFTGSTAGDTEWAVYARASFWGKLAVSALKHPKLIGLESQGLKANRSDEVTTLSGPKLRRPIFVTRIDDVVIAGTSRRLIDRARELEVAASQDSLLLAAPYADSILSVDRNEKQRDIELQVNVRKMREAWGLQKPFLDPASEKFTPAFLARLLPVAAIRRVLGVVDFDKGVSIDLSGDFSTELMMPDQKAIYRGKGFDEKELMELARFAPSDSTIVVYVRGPIGKLLEMVLASMEPAARDNLDQVCKQATYSGIDEVVKILNDSLIDRIAFIARPNDWDDSDDMEKDPVTGELVYMGPPHNDTQVFAWTIMSWISNDAPLEEMRNKFGNAGRNIGLQGREPNSRGYFRNKIGGGLILHEFWSQLIPGTGHIAVLNYGDVLMISNRYKMIDALTSNAVATGPGAKEARLSSRPDFQYQLQDVLPTGNAMVWFDPRSGTDLIRSQARETAEDRLKDSIDYRTERPAAQRRILGEKFGGKSRSSLPAADAERLDRLVDEAMGEYRDNVIRQNLPRELQEVDRTIAYLEAIESFLAVIRLDQKSFQLAARLVTPYKPE